MGGRGGGGGVQDLDKIVEPNAHNVGDGNTAELRGNIGVKG
jgi:hypothetical protein